MAGVRPVQLATNLALYPNPVAGAAHVAFTLPYATYVELTVTDALGRLVAFLDAGPLSAGAQVIRWERKDQPAGVYFFRLRLDGQPADIRRGLLSEEE